MRRWTKLPTVGRPERKLLSFLTPTVLSIIPTIPLFSSSPLSAFCLHTLIWPCPLIYISFIFSLISFCTHTGKSCTHTFTHTQASEMRTSRGTGVGVSRWKEANLWLDDWVIERVRGQSSKAVSLSTSLTQTRTNAEMQERQPEPILQS